MRSPPGSCTYTDWRVRSSCSGRLSRTQIRFAEYAFEQAQQKVAPAAYCPRAAIGEVKDHGVRNHSGLQRPEAFLKLHRSAPFRSAPIAAPKLAVPVFIVRDLFARKLPVTAPRRVDVYNKHKSSSAKLARATLSRAPDGPGGGVRAYRCRDRSFNRHARTLRVFKAGESRHDSYFQGGNHFMTTISRALRLPS